MTGNILRGIIKKYNSFLNMAKQVQILLLFIFLSCSPDGGSNGSAVYIPLDDGVIVDTEGRLSITQFGITWLFDKVYVYGHFANGDYWVIGPVSIISISPASTDVSGRVMNGSMINPVPGSKQGYDSACFGETYSADLNVATGISSTTPLVLQNGTSLVSTVSKADPGVDPQLKTAAVLTVLSTSPATGSFRPPYCGTGKTVKFNISQLNYELLGSLEPVADTPELSDIERKFERVWLDHIGGWTSRYIHPEDNMSSYGTQIAADISWGAIMLHLNFTDEEKKTLLIRYVQLGIDNFGVIQSGGLDTWAPDGGHCQGRKWPVLFAGMMLNDTNGSSGMKDIGLKSGDYLYSPGYGPGNIPPDYVHFQEDGQTFHVTAEDVALSHYYPNDEADYPEYSSTDIGMPEWGIRHSSFPSWDGNGWDVAYRNLNAYAWIGFILSARIMHANTSQLWNNSALFDYADRHMAVTASPESNPAWRSSVSFWGTWGSYYDSWRTNGDFVQYLWDANRHLY